MNPLPCNSPLQLLWYFLSPLELSPTCRYVLQLSPGSGPPLNADYLRLIASTLILEAVVYVGYWRWVSSKRQLWPALLVGNLLTHPIVIFVLPRATTALGGSYAEYLLMAELFAPAVEAVIVLAVGKQPPLAAIGLAVVANLFSWLIGLQLYSWFSA